MSNTFKITLATISSIVSIPLFFLSAFGTWIAQGWGQKTCGAISCHTLQLLCMVALVIALVSYIKFLRQKQNLYLSILVILTVLSLFLF
jgi:hypothetical protein